MAELHHMSKGCGFFPELYVLFCQACPSNSLISTSHFLFYFQCNSLTYLPEGLLLKERNLKYTWGILKPCSLQGSSGILGMLWCEVQLPPSPAAPSWLCPESSGQGRGKGRKGNFESSEMCLCQSWPGQGEKEGASLRAFFPLVFME